MHMAIPVNSYASVPVDGIVLLDPATRQPYRAQFTTTTVEGDFDATGLAQESKQDTQIDSLNDIYEALAAGIDVTVTNPGGSELAPGAATATNQQAIRSSVDSVVARLNTALIAEVTGSVTSNVTQSVLPTGAATAAKQDSIVSAIGALQTSQGGTKDVNITNARIPVTDDGGSLTVDAVSLPLPTGAATAAKQDTEIAALGAIRDAVQATQNVAVTSTVVTPVSDNGGSLTVDGTVGISGPVEVSNQPTGYATSAGQDTGNASLAGIASALGGTLVVDDPIDQEVGKNVTIGTTVGSTYEIDVSSSNGLTLQIRTGGTAGGAFAVEGIINDGNTNTWASVSGRTAAGSVAVVNSNTGALAANTNYRYTFSTNGIQRFRLRVTTALGAALADLSYATHTQTPDTLVITHPNGTQAVSGTVTANQAAGTAFNLTTAASTNANVVKSSAGNLMNLMLTNTSAATVHFKLYNTATSPTVGTTVPVATIPVAANSHLSISYGAIGQRFATGISIATTGGIASTDTAAIAAGCLVLITYV